MVFNAKLHDRNFESFFFNFVFFVWSGIVIHGHLTKNHEDFQISCHLLPASKGFSKIDSHLIPLLSGRQNHQNIQKKYFLENFDFFDRFESFQDARSVFKFWIFDDFGSPIRQIRNLGVPKFRSQPN